MILIALTHSARVVDPARCSHAFLRDRYADPARLELRPPFESLDSYARHAGLPGPAVSFFRYDETAQPPRLTSAGCVFPPRKVQHAVIIDERSVRVCYGTHLETWRLSRSLLGWLPLRTANVTPVQRIAHPHFPGLHTAFSLNERSVLVPSSGSDRVFLVDSQSGRVQRTFVFPDDAFAPGYDLTEAHDLRAHYIHNDLQRTHVNCASPFGEDHFVVSTLIDGVIGTFDLQTGEFSELARGYHGAHGARSNTEGEVYFCDSPRGQVVFLDRSGALLRQYRVDSIWLHDAQQLYGSVYALSVADANALRIVDLHSGNVLAERRFVTFPDANMSDRLLKARLWRGAASQFLSAWSV